MELLLIGFLTQLLSTAGVIFIFGSVIALLRRAFCRLTGSSGPRLLLATGIIGTPIHEISHALMCLLFGHKISEIKLYQPNSTDGTLGYVSHSYNKKNIYHQIGNFFIGTAPVLIGSLILTAIMFFIIPTGYRGISSAIATLGLSDIREFPITDYFTFLLESFAAILSPENLSTWQGWVFILLAIMISTHMEMSGSDIKSGLLGLLYIAIIVFVVDAALFYLFPHLFTAATEGAISFALRLSAFLSIPIIFLSGLVILALLIRLIVSIFRR